MSDRYCNKLKPGGEDGAEVWICVGLAGHTDGHTYGRRELVEQVHETANPVQEAWAALGETCCGGDHDGCPKTFDAARDLALATAKAMLPPRNRPGAKTGVERRYLALKAQIEGLGR